MNRNRLNLLRRLYRNAEPGDEGTGSDVTPAPAPEAAPSPPPAPDAAEIGADAGETDAAAAPAPAVDPNAPKSLLEAISQSVDGKKADAAVDPAAAAAAAELAKKDAPADAADPAKDAVKDAKPEDLTVMPEGLGQKAKERFGALVAANKEVTQEVTQLRAQTEYIGTTFKEHGITREQFELASGLIGAMNRGDWPTVIAGMQEQMRAVALLSGKPIEGIDALVGMPDLKEKVESLQLSPEDAAELARGRAHQQIQQRHAAQSRQEQERQQQSHQQEQQHARAVQQATLAVDKVCSELKASDLDFGRIEAALLPQVAKIFARIPPAEWAEEFKSHYQMMKSMGAPARGNSAGTLRAGGANNPVAKPADMFQAMFGEART